MPTVLIIRHGESQSNIGLPTSSPQSARLTALGKEQAECLADYLESRVSPDLIVTSSYERTRQTAVPTNLRFPSVPELEWPVHEFTYLSEVEFPALSTVEDRKPLVNVYWEVCDPTRVDGPGSESFEMFIERVRGVMAKFEGTGDKTIAIFSHEQFICAIYWLLKCNPERISSETMRDFRDFLMENSIPNAAFLRLQRSNDQNDWQPEVVWPLLITV
jgi:probable phosphoglycerate mutase